MADNDVVLTDQGDTVVLDNGIISFMINKDLCRIISLKKGEQELMGNSGSGYHQRISYDDPVNLSEHSTDHFTTPENCTYSILRNTADLVEISMVENDMAHYPFIFESHFILKRGESGFYNFVVLEYQPWIQPWASLMQLNICLKLDPDIFEIEQVSDDRWHIMPEPDDIANGQYVMDATYALDSNTNYAQLYDDPVYTKYNMIVMHDNHHVHGACTNGAGYGAWIIRASAEYLNGAPETQELTVHQTDTNVVLLGTYNGVHFGSSHLFFDETDGNWKKMFGPQFIYLNEDSSHEQMWTDAKNKAQAHVAQWPYQWVQEPLYETVRSTVSGRLEITSGHDPSGALIVLAKPMGADVPNWQKQGKEYTFWTWADQNGNFTVTDVKAGDYALYASVDGLLDEFIYENITVSSGDIINIGTLKWTPEKYGRTEWQIGVPDRNSTEFRGGDDFRHWGGEIRDRYLLDFPSGVDFNVGTDDWRTDWNFAQMNTLNSYGDILPTTWRIRFDLDTVYQGTTYLRLGIAGSRSATLAINLGRRQLGNIELIDGQGYPRSGSKGYYYEVVVPFDASYLSLGENIIALKQTAIDDQYKCIHYDCITLELPYKADANSDLEVTLEDFGLFASGWIVNDLAFDFNEDNLIGISDLNIIVKEWLR